MSDEGKWAARLTKDKSLAKHRSDTRFDSHDKILLSTDPGVTFEIEDDGNWEQIDEPADLRVIDHFDRYFGFATPTTAKGDFPMAFVVTLS